MATLRQLSDLWLTVRFPAQMILNVRSTSLFRPLTFVSLSLFVLFPPSFISRVKHPLFLSFIFFHSLSFHNLYHHLPLFCAGTQQCL